MRLVIIAIATLLVGCANLTGIDPVTGLPANTPGSPAPQESPNIRGTLTSANSGAGGGTLVIEEDPANPTAGAKVSLKLVSTTNLLRANGTRASFQDFKSGLKVEAWYEPGATTDFPVQATARAVRLVP